MEYRTCALLISLLANSFNVTACKALLHAASSFLVSFSLSCLAGFKLVLWLTLKLCFYPSEGSLCSFGK